MRKQLEDEKIQEIKQNIYNIYYDNSLQQSDKSEQLGAELNHLAKKYEYQKDFISALIYHQIDFYVSMQCKTPIEAARSLANLSFCSKQIIAQNDSDEQLDLQAKYQQQSYCYAQTAFGCLISDKNQLEAETKPPMVKLLQTTIENKIRDQDFLEVLVSASIDNINTIVSQNDSGFISYDILQWIILLGKAYINIDLIQLRYYNTMCNLLILMFSFFMYLNEKNYTLMKQMFQIIDKCYLNTNPLLYPFLVNKSSNYIGFLLMFQVLDGKQYNIQSIKQIVQEQGNTPISNELITVIFNVINQKVTEEDMKLFLQSIRQLECYKELNEKWHEINKHKIKAEQLIQQAQQITQIVNEQQQMILYDTLQQKLILSISQNQQTIIQSISELNQFLIKFGNNQNNLRKIKNNQKINVIYDIINIICLLQQSNQLNYLTNIAFIIMISAFYKKYMNFDIDECKDIIYDCLDQLNDAKNYKNGELYQIDFELLEEYLNIYSFKQAFIKDNISCQIAFQIVYNSYTEKSGDDFYEYQKPIIIYDKNIQYDQLMLDSKLILQVNRNFKPIKDIVHFTRFERPKQNQTKTLQLSKEDLDEPLHKEYKESKSFSEQTFNISKTSISKTSLIDTYKTTSFKDQLEDSMIQQIISIQIPQSNILQHISQKLPKLISLQINFQNLYRQDYENISKQTNISMLQLFSCTLNDEQNFNQIFIQLKNLYFINLTNTITTSETLYNMIEIATLEQIQLIILDSSIIILNNISLPLTQFQMQKEYKIQSISFIKSNFKNLDIIPLQISRQKLYIENLYIQDTIQPEKLLQNLSNLFILKIKNCFISNQLQMQQNNIQIDNLIK